MVRDVPGPLRDVFIEAFRGVVLQRGLHLEDRDFIRAVTHSVLEQLEFTGRIEAVCMALIESIYQYDSVDAFVEPAIKLVAPGEDVSELLWNTSSAFFEWRALQRGQELALDTIMGHLVPSVRVINGFLGLANSSTPVAETIHAAHMRVETIRITFAADNQKPVIDLSKFMPVVEPLGVSRKGVELIARSLGIRFVNGFREDPAAAAEEEEEEEESSAGDDGCVLDSNRTGMSTRMRNWFVMIRRRILTVLLALWLDHRRSRRSMLWLWGFIGLLMAVTALLLKSLFSSLFC